MHPQSTVGFINNFHSGDISNVTIDGFSGHFWAITPPTLKSLIAKVKNRDSELLINFRIECRRPPKEYQSGSLVVDSVYTRKITTDEREELLQELSSTIPYSSQNTATDLRRSANVPASSSPFSKLPHSGIWLRRVVPRFYLAKKDTIRPAPSSLSPHKSAIDIRVLLRCGNSSRSWWELQTQTIGIDTCFNNSKSAPYFATYSAALDSTLALSSTSKPSFSRTNQPIDSISTPIPTSGSSQHDTSILPFEITHTVSNLSNISRKLFTRSLEDEIGPNLAFGSKESGTTNQDTTSLINNDCAGSNVYLPSFMQTLQIIIFSERVSDHLLGKLVTVYG
ncbi:unnamed protein product [Protopolystoma xenopodis]|uniref:Piezo non-specific cation channel cap domain-containing protein n=1 Tax=Protopolystoma xenopodis TaxID=117903 RepID=A0A448WBR2_9PLAT|nr:unnamed protein product [Protopolystoma xenopodis]